MNAISEIIANNPLASIGLVSLLIPILIHLFNPNRGKTVLIGNLYLIKKVKNKKVTEIKIRQWLLLAVRLIFLIALTLLLIDLLFPKILSTKQTTSIFVTNSWLEHATTEEKENIFAEPTEKAIYLMQPGFKKVKQLSSLKTSSSYQFSLDSLISEAYAKQLLTANNQIYFSQNNDFLAQNRHFRYLASQPDISFEWIKLEKESRDSKSTSQIKVFYSPDRIADFELLKPALDLIAQSSTQLAISYHPIPTNIDNLLLDKRNSEPVNNYNNKLYFWLSSMPIPESLQQHIEQGGSLIRDSQSVPLNGKLTIISLPNLEFNLYHSLPKLIDIESIPVWSSHHGMLLSYKPIGKGRLLQFHSRLNENWNNLAAGTVILDLVAKLLDLCSTNHKLQVANSTLYDQSNFSINENNKPSIGYQSYRNFIILILTIVWLLERFLSESKAYRHD